MLFLLFLAADTSPAKEESQQVIDSNAMQTISMYKLSVSTCRAEKLQTTYVCQWIGTECAAGAVKKISWTIPLGDRHRSMRMVDIRWIPTTVTSIIIFNQRIISPLDMRSLPRGLVVGSFVQCGITGTVDLHEMPEGIFELLASDNHISGTLSLLRLPPRLKTLAFNENQISVIYGQKGCIPAWAQYISMWPRAGEARPRYMSIDGSKMDPRIQLSKKCS